MGSEMCIRDSRSAAEPPLKSWWLKGTARTFRLLTKIKREKNPCTFSSIFLRFLTPSKILFFLFTPHLDISDYDDEDEDEEDDDSSYRFETNNNHPPHPDHPGSVNSSSSSSTHHSHLQSLVPIPPGSGGGPEGFGGSLDPLQAQLSNSLQDMGGHDHDSDGGNLTLTAPAHYIFKIQPLCHKIDSFFCCFCVPVL